MLYNNYLVTNSSLADSADLKPARIGVALGGGSARGYAHIGALASLERHDLAPNVIAGTSFGAVVGALYAAGQSISEMTEHASNMRRRDLWRQVADFGLHKAALFKGKKLEGYFEELTEGRHFADLTHEFVVVTTDVNTGERVLLREGLVARALRASVALPGIFSPVEIDGRHLVDGGLGSPVPLDTLEELGVDLAIGIGAGVEAQDSSAIQLAQRALRSRLGKRLHHKLKGGSGLHPLRLLGRAVAHTVSSWQAPMRQDGDALHVHTRPPINWLNFHKAELAITAGDEALEHFIPTIRKVILQQSILLPSSS